MLRDDYNSSVSQRFALPARYAAHRVAVERQTCWKVEPGGASDPVLGAALPRLACERRHLARLQVHRADRVVVTDRCASVA